LTKRIFFNIIHAMVERGKWIDFEGVGGSGKSTQIKFTHSALDAQGIPVVSTREPGGIPEAESIRELVFHLKHEGAVNADHQVAFFFAARHLSIPKAIFTPLRNGINVLSDRSYPSTAAYQGYGEHANLSAIEQIANIVVNESRPNGVILLDISLDTSIKRLNLGGTNGDPYDDEKVEYFERVITGYRQMAEDHWGNLNWYIINGEQPAGLVAKEVQTVVRKILSGK